MIRLWEGKLPSKLLEEYVLRLFKKKDPRVLVGPSIGEDAAIIDFGEKVLIVHSDPITGAVKRIGWYATHVVSNDIATRGAKPKWLLPVLIIPVGKVEYLKEIVKDIAKASEEIGATVIGGHTEFTPGISRPIISMTAIGEASKYVTTSMCKPGDKVILTKGVAIEGTSIIANELEKVLLKTLPKYIVERAKSLVNEISVIKEALIATRAGGVHAMHDPTEGGVACGLQELAIASKLGVVAYEDKMIVREETEKVLSFVGADPLKILSSGSLLIVADSSKASNIVNTLIENGIKASIIGEMQEDKNSRYIIRKSGEVMNLNKHIEEEIWRVLKRYKVISTK